MDPQVDVGWLAVVPHAALAALLVLLPGHLVARAAGLGWVRALALAPGISLAVLFVAGGLVARTGLGWSVGVGLLALALLTAVLWAAARVVARRVGETLRADEEARTPDRVTSLASLAAVVIGGILVAAAMVTSIPGPNRLPQSNDTFFHVAAIQLLVDSASADPTAVGEVLWYEPLSYPGGFHSLAATVAAWTGASSLVAGHATLLALLAVVWPLGMVTLLIRVARLSGPAALVAGPLCAGVTFVPLHFLTFGVVWSYAAALALVPGILVGALVLLDRQPPPVPLLLRDLSMVALGLLAAGLTQPSALFAVAIVGLPLFGARVCRWGRWWAVAVVVAAVGTAVVWWNATPPHQGAYLPGYPTDGLVHYVSRMGDLPQWVDFLVPALTMTGLVIALLRGLPGLVVAWLAVVVLVSSQNIWGAVAAQHLTWPWWSGHARMYGVLAIPTLLAMGIAVGWVLEVARQGAPSRGRPWAAAAILAGLGVLAVEAQSDNRDRLEAVYDPAPEVGWLADPTELRALDELAGLVPDGSVVMTDPLTGGTFIELMGVKTFPIGPNYEQWADTRLVDEQLDSLMTVPEVCAEVRSLGIDYVVTGGDLPPGYAPGARTQTLERVAGRSDFDVVGTAGTYTLRKVPDCA